jgi:hypothetical protein
MVREHRGTLHEVMVVPGGFRTRSRLRGSGAARRFQNAPQRPDPEAAPKSASTRVRHGRKTGYLRLTLASVALFRARGDAPEPQHVL